MQQRAVIGLFLSGTLQRYPDVSLIVPHGGGALPLVGDPIHAFMGPFEQPAVGKSATVHDWLSGLYYDMAGTPFPRQISALLQLVRAEPILYGSDYC